MKPARHLLIMCAFAAGFLQTASALETESDLATERAEVQKMFPVAFAPVVDDPALPRVLLIGDSISIGYTPFVRASLKGIANVHRVFENGGPTNRGLQQLDEWLGDGKWAVIHFNFGLHDIKRDETGHRRNTADEYRRNLSELTARLKKTGARLVFATTTPVPEPGTSNRHAEDVPEINAIAREIMAGFGVPVNDLYTVAHARLAEIQMPANVHYTEAGYRVLAEPVAAAIRRQLESRAN